MAKWWLVSWTTYGTWLPGDERGYCTWRKRTYVAPPKRFAKPGEPQHRHGCCAEQNQDQQSQQRKLMDGKLGDSARGHSQHAFERADQTEVATRHEAAVGPNIPCSYSPQPCGQSAKRQSRECMEPVESAVYGSDSE